MLAKLGLLDKQPICTDNSTRSLIEGEGFNVLDKPFHAEGNPATAGGCLAAHSLATWIIWRLVGEEQDYISRAFAVVEPFIPLKSAFANEVIRIESPDASNDGPSYLPA